MSSEMKRVITLTYWDGTPLEVIVDNINAIGHDTGSDGTKTFSFVHVKGNRLNCLESPAAILALINGTEADGWYCPTCKTGVEPRDVTFSETHEACGTYIGTTSPPHKQTSQDGLLKAAEQLTSVMALQEAWGHLFGKERMHQNSDAHSEPAMRITVRAYDELVSQIQAARAHCGKPFTAGMSCGECGPRVDYKALNSLMDQLNSWKVAAVALADAVAESGDDVNDINVHKAFDNVRRLETGKTPQSAVKQAAPDVALLEAAEWILDRFNTNGLLYQSEIDTFTEHFNTIKAVRAAVEGKS